MCSTGIQEEELEKVTEDALEKKTKNFSKLMSNIKLKFQGIQGKIKNKEIILMNIIVKLHKNQR